MSTDAGVTAHGRDCGTEIPPIHIPSLSVAPARHRAVLAGWMYQRYTAGTQVLRFQVVHDAPALEGGPIIHAVVPVYPGNRQRQPVRP